jgi:signal transduction histidine kinase
VLDSLEVKEPEIDVFVVDQDGNLTADSSNRESSSGPEVEAAATPELTAELSHFDGEPVVRFEPPGYPSRLIGIFPLWRDDRTRLGVLAIVRPLDALRADLEQTFRSTVWSSLTLIVGITSMGWVLMLLYVRWPLANLHQAMRAVREGDLSASLPARSRDELGAMAIEFNAMVRQLEQARHQLLEAAEAREALELALQHVDKLVTVGQLSAGLAHEIGSPLQVLSGRARALAARTDIPADVLRTARILEAQAVRIAGIVEQLLSLARRKAPHMVELELGPPVVAIVDLLQSEARRRGVVLELRCSAALPKVTADADQIQQVVVNLLTNALRATPRGGRIHVTLAESMLAQGEGLYEEPAVTVTVEDSGHGIAEDLQARIFEPFFTTWSTSGGTGLGLAVVKSIVDDHGGTIDLSSAVDRGTTFVVHLPVAGSVRVRRYIA